MIRYVLLLALVATASASPSGWTVSSAVDTCDGGSSVGCVPGAAGPGAGYGSGVVCCHTNKTSVAEDAFITLLSTSLFYTYDTITWTGFSTGGSMAGQTVVAGSSGRSMTIPTNGGSSIVKAPKYSVYDETLAFAGPFLGATNLTFTFDQPIDAFGLYIRDASTSDSIIHIHSTNGLVDDFLIHSVNHSSSQDGYEDDIVYVSAHHTSCDGNYRVSSMTFGPANGEEVIGLDSITLAHWGNQCTNSSISGYVYVDGNSNNNRDQGETGIDNVQIDLKTCTGTLIATTNTDNNGYYLFQELLSPGGCYKLEEQQPAGFNDSTESVGTFNGVQIGNAPNNQGDNVIDQIQVNLGGQTGVNYNFAEATSDPCDAPISADYCVTPSMEGTANTASVSSDQDGRALPLHTGVKLIFTKKTDCQL